MGHVNFDPIGAVIELLACGLARLDRPIHDLYALGHFQFWSIAFERISAGCGNRACGNEKPRPGNVAALDRLLDAHVAIPGTLGLHVTQRGEPLLQRSTHRNRGPSGP